jgi:hypothetical protein
MYPLESAESIRPKSQASPHATFPSLTQAQLGCSIVRLGQFNLLSTKKHFELSPAFSIALSQHVTTLQRASFL